MLISGRTGAGKTFIACALGNAACRQGHSALYVRVPQILGDLALGQRRRFLGRHLMPCTHILSATPHFADPTTYIKQLSPCCSHGSILSNAQ